MYRNTEYAVSPVVGVMLMLVVTIIIAAVVAAFAGGISASQSRVPQVSVSASYSQSHGMTIYNNGGDSLAVGDFKIFLTPSKNFYSIESDSDSSLINQSLISNSTTMWYDSRGGRAVPRFAPGDVAYISVSNCSTEILTPSLMYTSHGANLNYGINSSQFVGATFYLDFTTLDGKRITRVEVPITS